MKGVHATDGARVGWVWVAPAPAWLEQYGERDLARVRWLGQITVQDELRGHGYGRALLDTLPSDSARRGPVRLVVYDRTRWDPLPYEGTLDELVDVMNTDLGAWAAAWPDVSFMRVGPRDTKWAQYRVAQLPADASIRPRRT
jgi:GNAT superfamily N-acetyltransferase